MPAYFFDSSALVKRFAREQGSAYVLSLLRPSTKNRLYVARITEVEVCAALTRRRKATTINATQASKGLRRLRHDLPQRFTQIAIVEGVLVEASRLAETFALRGYDAVQLAAAMGANNERVLNGLSPLILVSAGCGAERRGARRRVRRRRPKQPSVTELSADRQSNGFDLCGRFQT